ncbi:DNA independent RNA polymerase I transcription factor [Kickxella alabastrina]|uniref:DNA independent RNA polymerase I transcription factor n=1 Tax=Kickxella alabastrina TaxID=61397 RepID=A0ACC1IWR0_9FUNG|nr:DNA independent RNA polymerase I transcription factor [Kickxella alabastrina]
MEPSNDAKARRPIKQPVSRRKHIVVAAADQSTETAAPAPATAAPAAEETLDLVIDKSVFLRKFTENALQQVKEGNPEEYYKLVKVFAYSRTASHLAPEKYEEEVTPWISALSSNVSALGIYYRDLVTTIFNSDWVTCNDERFVHRYTTLILQILSAHPAWIPQAMPAMVRWFTYGGRKTDNNAIASLVHDRLHSLIKEIYRTIPTCGASLAAELVKSCPFKKAKSNVQVLFIQNVLRCLEYAIGVRREVLRMVLNHVIQIDVEVQVELEDLDSDDEADADEVIEDEGIFHFEDDEPEAADSAPGAGKIAAGAENSDMGESDGDESGAESDYSSDSESDWESSDGDIDDEVNLEKARINAKKTVAKLDAVMSTIFAWLEKHCQIDLETKEMPESTSKMYLQFLDLFITIVLPTFKSRYTQFFLFYLCAQDPQYADLFLGTMMGNVGEPVRNAAQDRVSNVEKLAAASYLGSFVARAKFLPVRIVRNVIGVLVQWANAYLDWHEEQVQKQLLEGEDARGRLRGVNYSHALGGPASSVLYSDFERHTVFYAVTQAILYVYCFRWRDLAEASGGGPVVESELDSLRWCPEVEGLQRVVFSKLNPLRACSSSVAQQFALVASQTNFMFCYSLLQQNRRKPQDGDANGSSTKNTSNNDQALRAELDTFFPFDPISLPISRQFIDSIYLVWQDVGASASDEEDGDGSGDEAHGNRNEDEDDANEAGVVGQMVAMSISPVMPLSALPGQTFSGKF